VHKFTHPGAERTRCLLNLRLQIDGILFIHVAGRVWSRRSRNVSESVVLVTALDAMPFAQPIDSKDAAKERSIGVARIIPSGLLSLHSLQN
jgi:hypothetical protein